MRSYGLSLLLIAFPIVVHGQNAPTQAFREWARDHVHPIASVEESPGDADLQTLDSIIGGAHVVAFGEPFHGGHEPLAMRNRLIRYGVTRLGFTAVALETCLSPSKRLYDHVLGRTTETDSALKEASAMGSVTFRRTSNSFDGCAPTTPANHQRAGFASTVSIWLASTNLTPIDRWKLF